MQWQLLLQSSKLGNIDLVNPSPQSRVLCSSNSYKVRGFEEQFSGRFSGCHGRLTLNWIA